MDKRELNSLTGSNSYSLSLSKTPEYSSKTRNHYISKFREQEAKSEVRLDLNSLQVDYQQEQNVDVISEFKNPSTVSKMTESYGRLPLSYFMISHNDLYSKR